MVLFHLRIMAEFFSTTIPYFVYEGKLLISLSQKKNTQHLILKHTYTYRKAAVGHSCLLQEC